MDQSDSDLYHIAGVGSTFIVQLPVKHEHDEEDDSAPVGVRGHSVSFGTEVSCRQYCGQWPANKTCRLVRFIGF